MNWLPGWVGLLVLFLVSARSSADQRLHDISVRNDALQLRFDGSNRFFELVDHQVGTLLAHGVIKIERDKQTLSSTASDLIGVQPDATRHQLVCRFRDKTTVHLRLNGNNALVIESAGEPGRLSLRLDALVSHNAVCSLLQDQQPHDRKVLVMTLGPAEVPGAKSLFDPDRDLAMTVHASHGTHWSFDKQWQVHAVAQIADEPISAVITRQYYREHLDITFYTPFAKRQFWKTAPIVAMTWYGVCGMHCPQQQKRLEPEINWIAKHLLPYAEQLVLQIDDNYDYTDDAAMRQLSDFIRRKGLIPGIWFTPFSVVPKETAQACFEQHPDWFLVDEAGVPMTAFAGLNWGWRGHQQQEGDMCSYILNVDHPIAVKKYFQPFWQRIHATWNFDFFKIDGQPFIVDGYRMARNGGGLQGYRKGLKLAREIVGADKFINACIGPIYSAIGLVEGSRIGRDSGYHAHACNLIVQNNYLNNFVWWCDPDAAAVLHDKPTELARLNAQARTLTGQQFLTDDYWTKIPKPTMRVWQRSFPNLDIRPANLYPINNEEWQQYDLFDLRIAKPWGTHDVVGLFNFSDQPTIKTLSLSRLPLLAQRVYLFEFWTSTYLGCFLRDDEIKRPFRPHEGQVFAVVPADADQPTVISTSRHISQGGLDLASLHYQRDGNDWIIQGKSTHLVKGDPYEIVFARGRYQLTSASGSAMRLTTSNEVSLARLMITPGDSTEAEWRAVFSSAAKP